MFNKAMIIGRVERDGELRQNGNRSLLTLSVATDESYNDKEGNRVERSESHRVVIFGAQAESHARLLTRGRLLFVEGTLRTRKWPGKDGGPDRYVTEIVAFRFRLLDDGNRYQNPSETEFDPFDRAPNNQIRDSLFKPPTPQQPAMTKKVDANYGFGRGDFLSTKQVSDMRLPEEPYPQKASMDEVPF